jgi:hypothetical protein
MGRKTHVPVPVCDVLVVYLLVTLCGRLALQRIKPTTA